MIHFSRVKSSPPHDGPSRLLYDYKPPIKVERSHRQPGQASNLCTRFKSPDPKQGQTGTSSSGKAASTTTLSQRRQKAKKKKKKSFFPLPSFLLSSSSAPAKLLPSLCCPWGPSPLFRPDFPLIQFSSHGKENPLSTPCSADKDFFFPSFFSFFTAALLFGSGSFL